MINFLKKKSVKSLKRYKKTLEEFKFNDTLVSIWELISVCDEYIEKESPWEKKENQKTVINNLLYVY